MKILIFDRFAMASIDLEKMLDKVKKYTMDFNPILIGMHQVESWLQSNNGQNLKTLWQI